MEFGNDVGIERGEVGVSKSTPENPEYRGTEKARKLSSKFYQKPGTVRQIRTNEELNI